MTDLLLHPLGIYVLALGAGFLIPLFDRAHRGSAILVFLLALACMVGIAGFNLFGIINGATAIDIETAGIKPPFSINLRFGLLEGGIVLAVNTAALLGAWHYLPRLKEHASALLLYLILVMGINGMVMTRDLFNLFIFIEITSIATYALIGMERSGSVLAAGFKYIVATSIASAFFLLGTIFIYYQTGTLNIDDIIANQELISGPIGFIATLFVLTGLLIELKPYPANGWGLDVYETASTGIASLISVGVSAGMFFAVYKLLPLAGDFLHSIAFIGGLTFLFSNIIGLKQDNTKRLLGYSSIGQIGLLTLAMALLAQLDSQVDIQSQMYLIVGGLFVNHLFAKAGLFWLAGLVKSSSIRGWSVISKRRGMLLLLGIMMTALVGLPPFPGFWAKWELVMLLASNDMFGWISLILLGSLLEAAYLFRWFSYAQQSVADDEQAEIPVSFWQPLPVAIAVLLLFATSYVMAAVMQVASPELYLPLVAGFALWLIDGVHGRYKNLPMLVAVAIGGYLLTKDLDGINSLFSYLLIGGGLLVSIAALYRKDDRKGFYPLLAVLLLSLATLLRAQSSLEFFFSWELMTLSSYLLITLGRDGAKPALSYLLFSLGSAYLIFAGFAVAYGATGSLLLSSLGNSGESMTMIFSLLAAGFIIKMGGFGFHIWLPDAYAEADDDFTALLSSVVSKAGVFGLVIIAAQLGVRSDIGLDPAYVLGWIGILTATFGALMAVFQEDLKRLLAYSSMGQLGYIVTGVALMSHLGWVSAMYMTVNHFLFKGILLLSAAGIILRTNQRLMYKMGGLIKNMPFTFTFTMIAIIAMSGVPPLTGYGGKWMMFNALMDKGWYWIAALAFFSSAIAFLYMFRLLQTVFLGQRKLEHHELREAPAILLIPQGVMIACIMVVSAYPKLLLDPLSAAIDPWIANTLVWEGTAMVTNFGYWNAPMIMGVVGGVWMVPLILLLLISLTLKIQKVEQFNIVFAAERPRRPEETHYAYNFFAHYDRAIGFLVRPRATAFWNTIVEWSHTTASSLRIFYNGNGQTYALFVVMYFVAMFLLNGGLAL
ncbi:MAG: proton-conducting membrane transporter [Gammaproteobacteria bacterium]|nr:proton-conducting membrane transporter [Gammaproteobacteria bacterium]NNJ50296.1 proton-conducting membrane transporter [Gammaproteobacteria bacterium]